MKIKFTVFAAILLLFNSANAGNSGLLRWEYLLCKTTSLQYYDNLYGVDIAVDAGGYVYSLGYGEKTLGGKPEKDVVITKMDSTTLLAERYFSLPDTTVDIPKKFILTATGKLYLLVNSSKQGYANSCQVYCLDNNLNLLWTKTFINSVGNGDDFAEDIVVDAAGNVTIAGTYSQSGQGKNIFIHRIKSTMQVVNKRYTNSSSTLDEGIARLTLDAAGALYLCGYQTSAAKGTQYLMIKYSSSIGVVFKKFYDGQNGVNDDAAADVTLDNNKNIYVTGKSFNTATGINAVTLKYDSTGTLKWSKREIQSTEGRRIIVYNNEIYVACEGFLVNKYDTAGNNLLQFIPPYGTHVNDFEIDGDGNVFAGGRKDTLVGTTLSNEGCLLRWNSAGVVKTKITLPAVLYNGVVYPAECKNITTAFDGLFSIGRKYRVSGGTTSYCMKTQKFARNLARINSAVWVDGEMTLSIYPNPVADELTVNAPAMSKISLYNMQGKLVVEKVVQGSPAIIDMSELEPALYLVSIEYDDKRTTKKIFKK